MHCKESISKLNGSRGFVTKLQWESGIVKFGIRNTTTKGNFLERDKTTALAIFLSESSQNFNLKNVACM